MGEHEERVREWMHRGWVVTRAILDPALAEVRKECKEEERELVTYECEIKVANLEGKLAKLLAAVKRCTDGNLNRWGVQDELAAAMKEIDGEG